MFWAMLIMYAFAFTFLAVWDLWFNRKTRKLLQKHQAEWNKIKAETPIEKRLDAYWDYCGKIIEERDDTVGVCFPRF